MIIRCHGVILLFFPMSKSKLTTGAYFTFFSLDNVSKGSCGWSTHSEQSSTMVTTDHVLTIEELRFQMKSCFSCGVSWAERHVSLDCSECGGYALERPCPVCEGSCGSLWKRDLTMSHASNRARWEGECLEKHIRPKTSETIAPLPLKHQEQHSRSWKFNNGNDKSTL